MANINTFKRLYKKVVKIFPESIFTCEYGSQFFFKPNYACEFRGTEYCIVYIKILEMFGGIITKSKRRDIYCDTNINRIFNKIKEMKK